MSSDPPSRSLPDLRALIDTLDHELLDIAAKRMAVVAEVAAYKRQHGLRVRDATRRYGRRDGGRRS